MHHSSLSRDRSNFFEIFNSFEELEKNGGKMKNHVVVVYVHAFVRDRRNESVSSVPRLDVSEKRDLRSLHPSVRA